MIKKFLIVPILLLIFLSIGMVSATDDVLADGSDSVDAISHDIEETQISEDMHADEGINESSQNVVNNCPSQTTTDIKADRVSREHMMHYLNSMGMRIMLQAVQEHLLK